MTLAAMLYRREQRSQLQYHWLSNNPQLSLLSMTMNIPGAVKTSPRLKQFFDEAIEAIKKTLGEEHFVQQEQLVLATGDEYYALLNVSPSDLKTRLVNFEQQWHAGRLLDLDVLYFSEGVIQQTSRTQLGLPLRQCYVCEQSAKVCARQKAHSQEELQQAISRLLHKKE